MRMQCIHAAAILLLVLVTGCSTIVHEKNQLVSIVSNPPGATLKIDNRSFITPAQVSLKGKSEYLFTLEKEGYKPASGKVDGNFRIWSTVVGNIFNLTGLLGFAVDFWATETAFELEKDNVITLQPLPSPTASFGAPDNPALQPLAQPAPIYAPAAGLPAGVR